MWRLGDESFRWSGLWFTQCKSSCFSSSSLLLRWLPWVPEAGRAAHLATSAQSCPRWHPAPPCRRNRLADAEARSEAAELAKIELSLKLAELAASAELAAEAEVDGRTTSRRSRADPATSDGAGGGEEGLPVSYSSGEMAVGGGAKAEALQRRAEAAELAAAAANRRAATAEAQVDRLKVGWGG